MRCLLVPLFMLASPAFAAEYAHCYTGEAPADAPHTTVLPPPMSPFYDAFDVTVVRFSCGHDITADLKLLDALMEQGQCSPDSEIAAFVAETWTEDASAYRADMEDIFGGPEKTAAICASLEICAEGQGDTYSDACFAAFAKING